MTNNRHVKWWNIGVLAMALTLGFIPFATAEQNGRSSGTNDAVELGAAVKRDPFWPVGYVPKTVQSVIPPESQMQSAAAVDNSWSEAMKKVVINGVSSRADNEYFAVINGQVKSVGDTVTVNHGGTIYTWAVDGIEPPGSVKLRRVSSR